MPRQQQQQKKWESVAHKNNLVTFEMPQCVEDICKEMMDITQDKKKQHRSGKPGES